jgi:hypothetical protein
MESGSIVGRRSDKVPELSARVEEKSLRAEINFADICA